MKERKRKKKQKNNLLWFFVFAFILIFLFLRFFIFIPSDVTGSSMEPTLLSDDQVLVSTISPIERFDIVVFYDPNDTIAVKRVIGLPGETVSYIDEQLYIDDVLVEEPFLEQDDISSLSGVWTSDYTLMENNQDTPSNIPDNQYFVVGDNRRFSLDSRFYGSISEDDIIGQVKLVYYPFERFQLK